MIDVEAVADLAHELGEVVEHPGRLERVDPRPQRGRAELDVAPHADQALQRGLLAVDRDRVLEVAEQDVGLRRDVGGLGHHLLVGEVQEVDHPRGPERDLGQRCGRPDGQRLEEVAGVAHVGDDIDSPVNVLRCYSLRHAPSPARRARRLSRRPRCGPGPPRSRDAPRPSSTSTLAQVRYAVPHGPRPALQRGARRAHRARLRRGRAPAPPAAPRARRARRRGQPPPARLAGARPGADPAGDAPLAAPCAPPSSPRRRTSSRGARRSAPAACALGALAVGDLRFALRGGAPPPGFGARATIAQALAAACGRPVDPAFRRPSRRRQPVPLPLPPSPCPPCPPTPRSPAADRLPGAPTAACPSGRD